MAERSSWRSLFDRVERLVGQPLERAVLTDTFMDAVAGAIHLSASLREAGDAVSTALLHRFNLPAHTDLVNLAADVRRLEASIRDLSESLAGPPAPKRRAPRRSRG